MIIDRFLAGNYTYYFTAHDGTYPAIDPDPGIYQGPSVEEVKEPPEPPDNGGIPAFEFMIPLIGLIAIIFYNYRKRKCIVST